MTIEEFAAITHRVIARDGFAAYLPTAYFPERRHIAVLEGVPDNVDLEDAALKWAAHEAVGDEEYLVAFKVDEAQFKIVRRHRDLVQEHVFDTRGEAGRQP